VLDKSANRRFFGTLAVFCVLALLVALLLHVFSRGPMPSESGDSAGLRKPTATGSDGEGPNGGAAELGQGGTAVTPRTPDAPKRRVPKGVVAGRVVDEAGRPIAEAEVAVLMSRQVAVHTEDGRVLPPRREDLFACTEKTDSGGEFEVAGVPETATAAMATARDETEAVTCILVVQKDGYRMTWRDVRPGQYTLRLVLEESAGVISGRVLVAVSAEPVVGARIECRSATATTDAEGRFQVKVPVEVEAPQRIKVSVLCYPREPFYAGKEMRDIRLMQGEEVGDVLIELERGTGSIRGTIVEGEGRALVPGMRVRLYERDRMRPYYFPGEDSAELVVDAADGTFAFDGLRAGTYQVEAIKGDWNCSLSRHQVTVTDGAEPLELMMYVNTQNARVITGTVTGPGGEPIEGAAVWLVMSDRVVNYQPAPTDAAGRYGFQFYYGSSGTPPKLMVFCSGYEVKLVPIAFEVTQVKQLDVSLNRAVRVAGTVTDAEGRPLEGVRIRVEGRGLGPEMRSTYPSLPNPRAVVTTPAGGGYEFTHLPPGTYVVTAAHDRYVIAEQTVRIAGNMDVQCDFVLDAGAQIEGTVYDEKGAPLRVRSVVAVGRGGVEHDSTVSGGDGRFTLRTLPRDEAVDVLVLADTINLRSHEPFYHAKVEDVQPGSDDLRITAEPVRRGAVELDVVEAVTDKPLARYEVWCSTQPRAGLDGLARRFVTSTSYGRASVSSESGRVVLDSLLPGEHRFNVRADGFQFATSDAVEVSGGETVRVRVALKRYEDNEQESDD